jgi:AcrR family transcriptional regulator
VRRQRLRPEERRALILEAATELVIENGLAATSMPQIARAASVSLGTLSYHFESKDELIREILAKTVREFYAPVNHRLREISSPLEAIVLLATCHFEGDAWRQFLIWIDFWSRGAHSPELSEWMSERFTWYEEQVGRYVELGVAAGELAPVDSRLFARELAAMTDGFGVLMVSHLRGITTDEVRDSLRRFVEMRLLAAERPVAG